MTDGAAKLTLGPILFNWEAEAKRDFYYRIADEAGIDVVYVGEVVCSKRSPFLDPFLPDILDRLERSGKQVVVSTLALVMTRRELNEIRDLAADARFFLEANDISAVALMDGRRHVIGPFINLYNEGTLAYLAAKGACRAVLPNELPGRAIAVLAKAAQDIELEVQVFGRLPLAVSARCYHARRHKLHKDGCQYVCAQDADGLDVNTLTGERFLAINGTQTLSQTYGNLIQELAALTGHGISHFRLWPHSCDMVAVARIFRDVLDRRIECRAALARLGEVTGGAPFSNGFFHATEGWRFIERDQATP